MFIAYEMIIPPEVAMQIAVLNDTADRIGSSFFNIRQYLMNADELTLAYLDVSEKQRDLFLGHNLELRTSNNYMDIHVPTAKEDPTIKIGFDPSLSHSDDLTLQKMVAHEVGHFFTQKSENPLVKFCASRFYRGIDHKARKYPVISFVATSLALNIAGVPNLASQATAIGLGALRSYPNRLNEHMCDDFSDRLVPEISYFEAMARHLDNSGNGEMIANRFQPHKGLSDYFSTHPMDYERGINSMNRCEEYLEIRNQLGIPSLIPG